jgi:hypothetical protein
MYYKHEQDGQSSITIRVAGPQDGPALVRLAERDTAELPAGRMLVAFSGEELRAAIAIGSGEVISDPFHPTAQLVGLLRARAAQMRDPGRPSRRARLAQAMSVRRDTSSPQPAGTLRAQNCR